MIYAHAHDQNVADDYFTAMERVEQRLEIAPPELEESIELVKVQERNQILVFVELLAQPEISFLERLSIADQLRALFGAEHTPPVQLVN